MYQIAFICAITVLMYWRSIRYQAVSDDVPGLANPLPFKNKFHKAWLEWYACSKYDLKRAHVLTLLTHMAVCVMIYVAFGKTNVSLLMATMFCVNPITSQVSVWISGRSYGVTALLMLLSLAFPFLAPATFLGILYSPMGFFSPLAYIGSNVWYLALLIPIFWAIHYKRIKGIVLERVKSQAVAYDKKFTFKKFVIALKTLGFYFTLSIVPYRLSFYHSFMQSFSGVNVERKNAERVDGFFFVGLAVILFVLYSAVKCWTPVSWGVMWFVVCIAPYCNFIRMNQEIAERYAYIASIGSMFALATIIYPYPALFVAFITYYATRTWYFMPAYTDDFIITEYSCMEDPKAWYCWFVRANKMFNNKCIREALNLFMTANILSPGQFKVLFNIGIILKIIKKDEEGNKFLEEAKKHVIAGQEEDVKKIFKTVEDGARPLFI